MGRDHGVVGAPRPRDIDRHGLQHGAQVCRGKQHDASSASCKASSMSCVTNTGLAGALPDLFYLGAHALAGIGIERRKTARP